MMNHPDGPGKTSYWGKNKSTQIYVLIQGILVGLAGAAHGLFATLQGNKPTGGYLIALGIFTLIPNYLITGIAAIIVGVSVIVWTIGFIQSREGPLIFLALSILLFLVGGGVAQTLFFVLTWAVATRIQASLAWWKRVLPEDSRKRMAGWWLAILIAEYVIFLAAIGIWLVLSPPSAVSRTPSLVQYILWSLLGAGILLQPLTIVSGFARDIQRQSA